MNSLPPFSRPSEHPLGTEMTAAMQRLDGCPEACDNTETPIAAIPQDNGWLCRYCCTDCGTFWTTSWGAA